MVHGLIGTGFRPRGGRTREILAGEAAAAGKEIGEREECGKEERERRVSENGNPSLKNIAI